MSNTSNQTSIGARLGFSGTLHFHDAAGNVIGTTQMTGSVPLSETGLTVEQAKQLIEDQENGSDNHQ